VQAPEVGQAATRAVALWPAIWSAIAASFAALSSIVLVVIHRRNLLESARPELALLDWTRTGVRAGDTEQLCFRRIKNVGRGSALHLHIDASSNVEKEGKAYPVAFSSTRRIPILGPNEEFEVNQSIDLWWANARWAAPGPGHRFIMLPIRIIAWDARNQRHETTYELFIQEMNSPLLRSNTDAPGIDIGRRFTRSRPVWLLKVERFRFRSFVGAVKKVLKRR
jgi:hypothetical protein